MTEFSLLGFVEHLGVLGAELVHAQHEALERAAEIIEAEAKREIGEYQQQAGPFAPWQELAESTKDERVHLGFSDNEPLLRTGDLRDGIQHRVDGNEAEIGSNDDKAVWQELGTSRIPPRSFLGGAAVRKGGEAALAAGEKLVGVLAGESVVAGGLPVIE